MPYKDKEAQKEAVRKAVNKHRKGITSEGITGVNSEGITLDEGQRLHKGAAAGATVLSDGQLWYPGNNGYHPKECRCDAHPFRG